MRWVLRALCVIVLAGVGISCAARQALKPQPAVDVVRTKTPPFKPPEPSKKNWDWVQLTSDEWLKGEIKYLRNHMLEIDSDELDDLKFQWRKVKVLKSPRQMSIFRDDRTTVEGPVMVKDDKVVVKVGDEYVVFARDDLLTIVPGGKGTFSYWSGKLSLGATVRSGNTDQVDTSLAFKARRRAPESRFQVDYFANFSKIGGTETTNWPFD